MDKLIHIKNTYSASMENSNKCKQRRKNRIGRFEDNILVNEKIYLIKLY